MLEEFKILTLVCQKLDQTNIPYMLTGSLAANFYAAPRMTRDIDIVLEILEDDISSFYSLFPADDFYIDRGAIEEAIKYQTMFNIIHKPSVFKIDFVVRKNSSYRSTEFQRKQQIDFEGTPIWIVSLEDLIISKLLWAKETQSDYQIRDVKNLLTSGTNLDMEYLNDWVQSLGLHNVFAKANSNG
jgi:predicted nucleotidyltransferase